MIFETVKEYGIEGRIKAFENGIREQKKLEEKSLEIIKTRMGNSRYCMHSLGEMYIYQAGLSLLKYNDVKSFRENMYIVGKLLLMSRNERIFGKKYR